MVQKSNFLVTCAIPCWNRAHFLAPTIDSVLQQDYPRIECIVVDAGSRDGTLEVLQSYGDRIRWVSEPDNGHADAINKGWKMGQGEILAWLNADDVWAVPHAVSEAVAFLERHPEVDLVYGDCGSMDAQGNIVGMTRYREWDLEYIVEHCHHGFAQPAAFLRRRILDQVGWLDTAFYQRKDHELWLRIGLAGQLRYLPEILAYERTVPGLTYDGKTAAPACVQVTRKFYSLPNVPARLVHKKRRAFSNSYLSGMYYAFVGGPRWGTILAYGFRGIFADPTNTLQVLRYLCNYLRYAPAYFLPARLFHALRRIKRLLVSPRPIAAP